MGRYAWLAEAPLHNKYTGMVVDVAHTVACHHLATDEPEQAAGGGEDCAAGRMSRVRAG